MSATRVLSWPMSSFLRSLSMKPSTNRKLPLPFHSILPEASIATATSARPSLQPDKIRKSLVYLFARYHAFNICGQIERVSDSGSWVQINDFLCCHIELFGSGHDTWHHTMCMSRDTPPRARNIIQTRGRPVILLSVINAERPVDFKSWPNRGITPALAKVGYMIIAHFIR